MIKTTSFINLCICLTIFKLLFMKSYVSTDFDVHRNWMAITYNLPIRDWYYDTTSEWTLDYPPLFAALEFLFALTAHFLNLQDCLNLTSLSIRSESVVIYQKITVLIGDIVYYYSIYKLCNSFDLLLYRKSSSKEVETTNVKQNLLNAIYKPDATSCIALLLLLQPGLLLVDHIHFQYNGFLSGVFLLSIYNVVIRNYASASFWFAILLNLKHIYLYCAPAYGMYLLTSYCMGKSNKQNRMLSFCSRTIKLGAIVLMVFVITYLPFMELEILKQILHRLFPFKRGLTHAYWAPNLWALYNTADKAMATVFKNSIYIPFDKESISSKSSTSGLVQEYKHQYLPTIQPSTTFVLVGLFTIPLVIKFLLNINKCSLHLFIKGVTVANFTSFMFGWHVHEKAIILVLLPLIPLNVIEPKLRPTFLRLTLAGTYSLFPLLFKQAEYLTKVTLLISYYYITKTLDLSETSETSNTMGKKDEKLVVRSKMRKLYILLDKIYLLSIVAIEIYINFLHGHLNYNWNPLAELNKFAFLPLMMNSSLTSLGVTLSYLELYYDFVCGAVVVDKVSA